MSEGEIHIYCTFRVFNNFPDLPDVWYLCLLHGMSFFIQLNL